MTRGRLLILFLLLTLSTAAALALRDTIYVLVVVPLAYLWWLFGLYYHLVPQVFLWAILIVVILFTAVRTILIEIPVGRRFPAFRKPQEGPVEHLTVLLDKRGRGIYYKWLIANRLGRVAREVIDQRAGPHARRLTRFEGRDWNPSQQVDAYLESGLNGSFADFPKPRWSRRQPTPLDQDPRPVVEFLESEMEIRRHGNR